MATRRIAPVRAIGGALKAAAYGFANLGKRIGHGLTLIPTYLAGLLWILSQQFLELARSGYGGNSAVYACLRLLSQAVPEPPLLAYRRLADGTRGDPLPYDHPLSVLLRTPNPLMTGYEMWELVTLQAGVTGRSVWWKERNNAGEIIALWPLRPDRVGPIYDLAQVISGWSYLVPGTTHYEPIPRADTFFVNWPDPAGESGGLVEGLGPLQVLAAEVGADNEATKFVGELLANHAQPGMVITTKGDISSPEIVQQIKAAARQEFGGIRRGSPAVLDADTTITQTGFNMQQLEFPALRKVSESRISAAFGVPAVLAQLLVGIENGQAYAALEQMREYFAETTLAAHWRRDQEAYTRDVASEFDAGVDCAFDLRQVKALQHQAKAETDRIAAGFSAGAVSYDEYRERVLGLPPLGLANGGGRRVLPKQSIEIDENGNVVEDKGIPLDVAQAVIAANDKLSAPEALDLPAPGMGADPTTAPAATKPGTHAKPKQEAAV